MCVFLKFICIYFFLYYRGPYVRKLFTGLIMYLPLQNKEHCIVLYCSFSFSFNTASINSLPYKCALPRDHKIMAFGTTYKIYWARSQGPKTLGA